jgi:hypothetical protein
MGVGARSSRHYLSAKFTKYGRQIIANRNIAYSTGKGLGSFRYKTRKTYPFPGPEFPTHTDSVYFW